MPNMTFEFETNEAMIEFAKSIPSQKVTSPAAEDCETLTGTTIITQDEEDVKDNNYFDEEIIFTEFPSRTVDDNINRCLATLPGGKVKLGSDPYENRVGARAYSRKLYQRFYPNESKFIERYDVPCRAFPGQQNRFQATILKEVDAFLTKHEGDYDKNELIRSLNTKKGKGKHTISADELIDMINESYNTHGHYGEVAERLYNLCRRQEVSR